MSSSDFEALCQAKPLIKRVVINDNGHGRIVYVRGLLAEDFDALQKAISKTGTDQLVGIAQLTLCDENGELLAIGDDGANRLRKMSLKWLTQIAMAGAEVNGSAIDDEDGEGN